MYPTAFDYTAASCVSQVCDLLGQDPGHTRVLAGGMSLLPRLMKRLERPRRLVDITRITELGQVAATPLGLRVGATVTQRSLEHHPDLVGYDILRQALPRVGTVPTRNRGTVCGNFVHADPAAQLGVCLVALGGELLLTSSTGHRRVAAADFFTQPYQTVMRTDELLTEAMFHRPATDSIGFFDAVSLRGMAEPPLVSVALIGHRAEGHGLRLVIGGAGQPPTQVPVETSDDCDGLTDRTIAHVGRHIADHVRFDDDIRASGVHRLRLAVGVFGQLARRLREETRS